MECLIVAANIIKAALSNNFPINSESDGSLNQPFVFQLILLPCRSKRWACIEIQGQLLMFAFKTRKTD